MDKAELPLPMTDLSTVPSARLHSQLYRVAFAANQLVKSMQAGRPMNARQGRLRLMIDCGVAAPERQVKLWREVFLFYPKEMSLTS